MKPFWVFGIALFTGLSFAFEDATYRRSGVPVIRARSQFPIIPPMIPDVRSAPLAREQVFKLRHVIHHGTYEYPDLHIIRNIDPEETFMLLDNEGNFQADLAPLKAKSKASQIQRLRDRSPARIETLLDHGRMTGQAMALSSDAWTMDDLPAPDHTDKDTVLTFARIAANAYVHDDAEANWESLTGNFNFSIHFGWENDGLRGHIFTSEDNSTIVVGLKGTSPAVFDGAETTGNDKLNDNLFFSCCCGQGGQYWWKQVCDCRTAAYTCNNTCVVKALRHRSRYYYAAKDLYYNVTAMYPNSQVWLAGHSLGGAVSSLLGLTFGLPVFAFEAPGDAMPASRLGLPVPPGYQHGFHQQRAYTGTYHFGHTADPIYMGTCNTGGSFCTLAGYAMESVCHTGLSCVYDTVEDFGWRSGIGTHRIRSVIDDVILKYKDVPECLPMSDCVDCYNWKYFESNHSITTTTQRPTTSPTSTTRSETCKTPGWWGCLDETTTTGTGTKPPPTTTSCKTPGWFGCKDPTTTADSPSSTTRSTSTTSTSTCKTPGWFGCLDPTTSYTATPVPTSPPPTVVPTGSPLPTLTTTSCRSWGWFGCLDPTTTASPTSEPTSGVSSKVSSTSSSLISQTTSCQTWGWFWCLDPSGTDSTPNSTSSVSLSLSSTSALSTRLPSPTYMFSSTLGSPTNTGVPSGTPSKHPVCIERTLYGWCIRWDDRTEL